METEEWLDTLPSSDDQDDPATTIDSHTSHPVRDSPYDPAEEELSECEEGGGAMRVMT